LDISPVGNGVIAELSGRERHTGEEHPGKEYLKRIVLII